MDKRKENGGHSTKAKGIDKRKNPFRDVISESQTPEDVREVLNMVKHKAITDQDIPAAKLYLEYTLGKPDQTIDVEGISLPIVDMSKWK
jgi:hypothetical protein